MDPRKAFAILIEMPTVGRSTGRDLYGRLGSRAIVNPAKNASSVTLPADHFRGPCQNTTTW